MTGSLPSSQDLACPMNLLRGFGRCWMDGPPQCGFADRTTIDHYIAVKSTMAGRKHLAYLIAGWRSQYRCPPASSPLSFRFGGAPSLNTLPVSW